MAHDASVRTNVRRLRAEGLTYSEILSRLKIRLPKSTLSDWCSDVVMPDWYQAKVDELNRKNFGKARSFAYASLIFKREKLFSELRSNNQFIFPKLHDKDVLKMLLAVLYLGEGAK